MEVRLGDAVARIEPKAVHLASGASLQCQTAIWAAGVKANPLAGALGLALGPGGRIVVGPDLAVPGDPTVFVVGDLAAATCADGRPLPQLVAVAMQEGRHAARQIRRRLAGRATAPFRYRDRGRNYITWDRAYRLSHRAPLPGATAAPVGGRVTRPTARPGCRA